MKYRMIGLSQSLLRDIKNQEIKAKEFLLQGIN